MPTPFWDDQPILHDDIEWVWGAFWILSTGRPQGMGTGGIPFEAMDRYAARYGIEGDEFEEFAHLIRAMDTEYLKAAQSNG